MLPLPVRYWSKDSHSLAPTSGSQVDADFPAVPFVKSAPVHHRELIAWQQKTKVMLDSTGLRSVECGAEGMRPQTR
jgi:hypothetical protein